jgi:mercuric ion transport protein
MRGTTLTGIGGVLAAFLGSLCCVGPLLFVTLGVGAGFASTFEPLRPAFGVLMLALLAVGFWTVYGRRMVALRSGAPGAVNTSESAAVLREADCAPAAACAAPVHRTRDVVILWCATALALVLWTFPSWSLWLL